MRTLQFYKYATLGLILLNLSIVAFFFLTKPPHPHQREGNQMRADQRLHLDKGQHETFLEYGQQHIQKIESLNEQQKKLLKPYFYTLIDSTQNVDAQNIMNEVKILEGQKIESTYEHFKEVKSILRPEQYVYFESFIDNILKNMLGGKKMHNRPKDF